MHPAGDFARLQVIPRLCKTFPSHRKSKCREIFFSIIMHVWEHYLVPFEDEALDFRKMVKPSLIRGLSDEYEGNRSTIFDWWNHSARLGDTFTRRLPLLMSDLYNAESEEHWPGSAASLLLKLCDSAVKYTDQIHTVHQTAQSVHTEMNMQTWAAGSNPLTTPLYSSSQSMMPSGMVEATQDAVFENTQFTMGTDEAAMSIVEDTQSKPSMDFVSRSSRPSQQWQARSSDMDRGFKRPAPRMDRVVSKMGTGLVRFNTGARGNNGNFYRNAATATKRKRSEMTQIHERSKKP